MKRRDFLPVIFFFAACKKDAPAPPLGDQATADAAVAAVPVVAKVPEAKPGADLKVFFPPDGVTISKTQSALLVHDRYVVSVSSQTLDEKARKIWLTHFKLRAL